MKNDSENINNSTNDTSAEKIQPRHRGLRKIIKICAWSICALLSFLIAALTALTIFLTPDNLTYLINTNASKYLKADVKTYNARFTFWSSFPHLYLEFDSIKINSRTLDNIPVEIANTLPSNSDFLASAGAFKGSVNMLHLLAAKITLKDVSLDRLRLNLVAYNDSINNYNILPDDGRHKFAVPRFSANSVVLSNPQPITFFSAATNTNVNTNLKKIAFIQRKKHNQYNLSLSGNVDATVNNLKVLYNFPFNLDGEVNLDFFPFRTKFVDFAINLGNTKGRLNMNLNLGDDPALHSLEFNIDPFRPLTLLNYLSPDMLPALSSLSTDMTVYASARLTRPYHLSSTKLPSFLVNFNIPQGSLEYTFSKQQKYSLNNIHIGAAFDFNGDVPEKSSFTINPISLVGNGIDVNGAVRVRNLMGNPEVTADLQCNSDLSRLRKSLPISESIATDGYVNLHTTASFTLADLQNFTLADVNLYIKGDMKNATLSNSELRYSTKLKDTQFQCNLASDAISASRVSNARVSAKTSCSDMSMRLENQNVKVQSLLVTVANDKPMTLNFSNLPNKLPAKLKATAAQLAYRSDTLSASVKNLNLSVDASTRAAKFIAGNLNFKSGRSLNATLGNPDVSLRISDYPHKLPFKPSLKLQPEADAAYLSLLTHTPEYVTAECPNVIKSFLNKYSFNLGFKSKKLNILTDNKEAYLFTGPVAFTATPDKVTLNTLSLRGVNTAADIKGNITGLRDWLLSETPVPIAVDMDVALDTVNINMLAHVYEQAMIRKTGREDVLSAPKPKTISPADSVAILIPRNIIANVRATAKETRYTNLHLYNLQTSLHIADGDAAVENLTVDSDFGRAFMDLNYVTSDVENMNVNLNVGVKEIDIVRFFQRFHTLLEMMPQMKNLSGYISADCSANFNIYPTMYLNAPGLKARLEVEGRKLLVHQSDFIRRITRMMLITSDDDLHIADINLHADVHDNLLELRPFDFKFDKYDINMVGLNNFVGDLYYHIGVMKSPFDIPFGINIKGDINHPELRFGGATYKIHEGEKIAENISETLKINLVYEMKYYMRQFIHKAAAGYEK